MPAGSQNSAFCQKSRVHQSLFIIADFLREIGRKNVVLPDYGVIKHVPALDAGGENPAALDLDLRISDLRLSALVCGKIGFRCPDVSDCLERDATGLASPRAARNAR